jgi:SAM-dependent methyltransferase
MEFAKRRGVPGMTKQAERDYPLHAERRLFETLPFSHPRTLREFGAGMEVFQHLLPAGARILDLGCGAGWTSQFLARAGYDVVGVDISEHMIDMARQRAERDGVQACFVVADMEELDLDRHDFDGVLLFDSLHHCPDYPRVLERACGHLRPGGHLLLMEPSWLHLLSPHARKMARHYGVTELGFTRWGLRRTLWQAGFERVRFCCDPGALCQGPLGFLLANFRLWCNYFFCFPRLRQIVLARKRTGR